MQETEREGDACTCGRRAGASPCRQAQESNNGTASGADTPGADTGVVDALLRV